MFNNIFVVYLGQGIFLFCAEEDITILQPEKTYSRKTVGNTTQQQVVGFNMLRKLTLA